MNEPWEIILLPTQGKDPAERTGKILHHDKPRFRCDFFIGRERPELVSGMSSYNVSTGVHLFNVVLLNQDGKHVNFGELNIAFRKAANVVYEKMKV